MHRRTVLGLAVAVPFAGCTGRLDDDTLIDATLEHAEPHEFDASEGDEIEVTVDEVVVEPEDDSEAESIMFQLGPLGGGAEYDDTLEEGESISDEVTLEEDGTYSVAVTNGTADVLIERL